MQAHEKNGDHISEQDEESYNSEEDTDSESEYDDEDISQTGFKVM